MDELILAPQRFAYLESVIERGRQTFIEVGTALMEIREQRLYRTDGWDTFEEYCQERWGWTRQRSHQLIDSAESAGLLSTRVDIPQPDNEYQVRPLAALPTPEAKIEAWQRAVESHGPTPTHAQVREAVTEITRGGQTHRRPLSYTDDDVHRVLARANLILDVDAEEWVRNLGEIESLRVFLETDLETAEAIHAWVGGLIVALRARLGDEQPRIRRVQ